MFLPARFHSWNSISHSSMNWERIKIRIHDQTQSGFTYVDIPYVQESKCFESFWKFTLFCLADSIIGTYVLQVTICQASIVQVMIIYLALRRRCVADLVEHQTSTRHVTMGTYPGRLTGTLKGGCHAQHLVTTSRVFINPAATNCIVLKNWNAVKCRPLRGNYCDGTFSRW